MDGSAPIGRYWLLRKLVGRFTVLSEPVTSQRGFKQQLSGLAAEYAQGISQGLCHKFLKKQAESSEASALETVAS